MKDDDVYGKGNAYTAQYWEYDPRLGRRWNVDPKTKVFESPYACFDNNPIKYSDPNGDTDDKYPGKKKNDRREARAERKFERKVTKPLQKMEAAGASVGQIQKAADALAVKYQHTKWLHRSLGEAARSNYAKSPYQSQSTNNNTYLI